MLPELTEERRREYIKTARHKAEDGRVAIRNIRRHAKDTLNKMIKNGDAGEDDVRRAIQKGEKIYTNARTIITPAARDMGEAAEVFAKA